MYMYTYIVPSERAKQCAGISLVAVLSLTLSLFGACSVNSISHAENAVACEASIN